MVWRLVDQNGKGSWRGGMEAHGAVNREERKRRMEQNGDDALWTKTKRMNSANKCTVRRERRTVQTNSMHH